MRTITQDTADTGSKHLYAMGLDTVARMVSPIASSPRAHAAAVCLTALLALPGCGLLAPAPEPVAGPPAPVPAPAPPKPVAPPIAHDARPRVERLNSGPPNHAYEIKGERYGDPELLDDGFDDFDCVDSTRTRLSQVLPSGGKRFRFLYEYDFGDDWEHEVLFEGRTAPEPGNKYPLCLDGERACPPEDVGGVWGYREFLAALADPKHQEHEEYLEWAGPFDSDHFDAGVATKAMRKGLPDWRR